MTSASKKFSRMFRIKFPTRRIFWIFHFLKVNGVVLFCKLIYRTSFVLMVWYLNGYDVGVAIGRCWFRVRSFIHLYLFIHSCCAARWQLWASCSLTCDPVTCKLFCCFCCSLYHALL